MGHRPPPPDVTGRPWKPPRKPRDAKALVRGIQAIGEQDALRLDPEAYKRGFESGKPDRVGSKRSFDWRAFRRWTLVPFGLGLCLSGMFGGPLLLVTIGAVILGSQVAVFESWTLGRRAHETPSKPRVPTAPMTPEQIQDERLGVVREMYVTGEIEPQDLEVMIADVLAGKQPDGGVPEVSPFPRPQMERRA